MLLFAITSLCACGDVESNPLLVPVGRSTVAGPNSYSLIVDEEVLSLDPVPDGAGGYWVSIPPRWASEMVVVQFTVKRGHEPRGYQGFPDGRWLAPSDLIDSGHPSIVETAQRITPTGVSRVQGARAIHEWVASSMEWRIYPDHREARASSTLDLGYGTCANHARLFVALARAAQIPARTVRGVTYDGSTFDTYHEWAEFQDEDSRWRPLDPFIAGSMDMVTITNLDLVYAAEENPYLSEDRVSSYARVLYDSDPARGRLGFEVIHSSPNSITVQNTFRLRDEAE